MYRKTNQKEPMKLTPTITRTIRTLHRDIGFLLIGIILLYSLSGIILTYRDTDFLKSTQYIEKNLPKSLTGKKLPMALHKKGVTIISENNESIVFKVNQFNGSYDKVTGKAEYTSKELPAFLDKIIQLHKTSSAGNTHWFTSLFGILLGFMAVSSFWMYKPKSGNFKRGLLLSVAGLVVAGTLVIA